MHNSDANDTAKISTSVSCFLFGALELDASFKKAGRQGGLKDAKYLIETLLYNLVELLSALVLDHTLRNSELLHTLRYEAGRGTPGRSTMSCQ